jgi:hypothetical protein
MNIAQPWTVNTRSARCAVVFDRIIEMIWGDAMQFAGKLVHGRVPAGLYSVEHDVGELRIFSSVLGTLPHVVFGGGSALISFQTAAELN